MKEREEYEEKLLELIETNFAFLTDEFWNEEDDVSGVAVRNNDFMASSAVLLCVVSQYI